MNILNVEKVSKTFGEKVLLDNVTLGINKGDQGWNYRCERNWKVDTA